MSDSASITCASCRACCCRLEVLLMGDDAVPLELTDVDQWGGAVMARLEDGWCAALDRETMLCRIYERRPGVCRDYEVGESDCIAQRSMLDSERESAGKSVERITWWLPDGSARQL